MAKTPEGLVKDMIKKILDKRDVYYKMIVPHPMGANVGISDFHIHHKGYFIALEAKPRTGNKKPTEKQTEYMDEIDAAGGFSFVVRNPEDMSRVEDLLDWMDKNPALRPELKPLRDSIG